MRALLADVTLTIGPDRAYVKLDGRAIGQAPIGHYLIPAGRHVIDVSADGYTSQTKELMVTAGVPLSITMALAIVPRTGRVRVQVSPAGASVKLDKVVYPPPIDVELPLGGHTLEAWATGYQVHREEILIAAGQTREVYVSLRKPPIYKRAALWVPLVVGLVVVGGVAAGLGVYYGTRDDRITGTLAPGQATVGR